VNALLLEIKKRLTARSLELSDLIEEVDRRKLGKIARTEFQRILTSRAIQLKPSEMEVLEKAFALPQNPNQIDSQQFLDEYRHPIPVSKPIPCCQETLSAFKQYLLTHGIDLLDILKPYDRSRRGFVSKIDFMRVFKDFKGNSEVANVFAHKTDGRIQYSEIQTAVANLPTQKIVCPKMPSTIENLLSQFAQRDVDVVSWFKPHDSLRRGFVSVDQFRAALSMSGIALSAADYSLLTNHYLTDIEVNYVTFVEDLKRVSHERARRLAQSAPSRPIFTVEEIVATLNERCSSRHLSIADLFLQFKDRTITSYSFKTVLQTAKLALSVDQIDFLAETFASGSGNVDLQAFLLLFKESKSTDSPSPQTNPIIQGIRQHLLKKQVRITLRLTQYDRDGRGEFASALLAIALRLQITNFADFFNFPLKTDHTAVKH
jgi:Ca2+-binding EF-hand superfamily protein